MPQLTTGLGELKRNVTSELALIAKFVLETSKKTLSTALTLILAVEVILLGTFISSDPSFGVLANIVTGNVRPPSVDSSIETFAQLTGAAVVFATSQVMVLKVPTS